MRVDYTSSRKVAMLGCLVRLKGSIRRCENPACGRYHHPYHPEEEGRLVLPHYEYGLDVLAFIGARRYQESASAPQIHAALVGRQVQISQRNVQYLLERYDELVTLSVQNDPARRARLNAQGRLILAVDGLQPDVGHEILWIVRELLSGEVLSARSLLSSTQNDLATLLREAVAGLSAPVQGVVSDGQHSIRNAVAQVFPGVPHQLCHFHYLKQAAGPAWEADRHAKKELKKRVRGIRPLERAVEGRDDEEARGSCRAIAPRCVGRWPMTASPRWSPAGYACTSAWRRSTPAWSGPAKKGGPAEATQADAGHPAPRLGGHRRAVVQPDPDLHLDRTGRRHSG